MQILTSLPKHFLSLTHSWSFSQLISVVIKAIHKGLFMCVIASNLDLVAATTEMEHEKILGNIITGMSDFTSL